MSAGVPCRGCGRPYNAALDLTPSGHCQRCALELVRRACLPVPLVLFAEVVDDAQVAEFEARDLGDDMAAAGTARTIWPRRHA